MRAHLLLVAWLAVLAAPVQARIVEERLEVPVEVRDGYGKAISGSVGVVLFRDDAAGGPRPAVVLQHGRATSAPERAAMGSARYGDASRWFVRQGFLVAVPTRLGYGTTGGEDVEDSGPCASKRYEPGFVAAAAQTLAVLDALRARADVDRERLVVLGQSYGGATAVAVAARNPPGVVAVVNVAGGAGGDPVARVGDPCSPQQLERTYAGFGATARVPMLWLYTENDRYWGPSLPKGWADAFRRAGGDVRFVQVPPHGTDGHAMFTRGPEVWQPVVAEFLREQGFAVPAERP